MKKTLCFTIVLAILSAGFLAGFSAFAAAPAESVIYTPESFFGDLPVLDGLSIEHEFHLDHRMSWSSSISIEGSEVQSECSFERTSIPRSEVRDYSRYYTGISIYSDCDSVTLEKVAEQYRPLANEKKDYVEVDIPLTELGGFYPVQIMISVPGLDAHTEEYIMGEGNPGANEAMAALLETFRIPADEDAWVHVQVAPDPAPGSSTAAASGWWMSDKGKQLFCTCPSVICGNTCYFAPSFEKYDYSKEGSVPAFAVVPEGGNFVWAIDFSYSISENKYYTDGKLDASSLRRVFETGDGVRTNALYKSADGKNLHMMTSEADGEWISTISLEDGSLLQREYLAESPATAHLAEEEEFIAMTYGTDRLSCVKFCEDGLFDIIIDCPLNAEEYGELGIDLYSAMNSFEEFTPMLKGDMLVFAYLTPRDNYSLYRMRYCSTDIGLLAYDPSGLLYAGKLNCCMEPASALFYDRDLNKSLQNKGFSAGFAGM